MDPRRQRTLSKDVRIEGIGLHTGQTCSVTLTPAEVHAGIRFVRGGKVLADLRTEASRAVVSSVSRCSAVGPERDAVLTVEHLLAALSGLGISNVSVEVEGPEIPGVDGSALPFVEAILGAGIREQEADAYIYQVREPIFCYDKLRSICIFPAETFSVSYTLDYDHPQLRDQRTELSLADGSFVRQIAPARTFCTDTEAAEIRKKGLGAGANESNTVVVRSDGSHIPSLRFPDECARHKVLDIVGDLALLGFPVQGRVVAIRSGHSLNRRLVAEIIKQRAV